MHDSLHAHGPGSFYEHNISRGNLLPQCVIQCIDGLKPVTTFTERLDCLARKRTSRQQVSDASFPNYPAGMRVKEFGITAKLRHVTEHQPAFTLLR